MRLLVLYAIYAVIVFVTIALFLGCNNAPEQVMNLPDNEYGKAFEMCREMGNFQLQNECRKGVVDAYLNSTLDQCDE